MADEVVPAAEPAAVCFNCGRAEDVRAFSFDLDLPTLHGCPCCTFALSMGDDDLLAAMKPRRSGRRRGPRGG